MYDNNFDVRFKHVQHPESYASQKSLVKPGCFYRGTAERPDSFAEKNPGVVTH